MEKNDHVREQVLFVTNQAYKDLQSSTEEFINNESENEEERLDG